MPSNRPTEEMLGKWKAMCNQRREAAGFGGWPPLMNS